MPEHGMFEQGQAECIALMVGVLSNDILTQNLYYNYNSPNPEYQIIGYMDPKH